MTRAMVQWCVAVHTTFRLVSWLRGVLWRARWSWRADIVGDYVGDQLNLDLFFPFPMPSTFAFFFYLWLWLWLWLRLFFGPCQIPWVFVFRLHFFLPFFSFFFSLRFWLELVALLFIKAGIPIHMARLGPDNGDLILFCNTKNG